MNRHNPLKSPAEAGHPFSLQSPTRSLRFGGCGFFTKSRGRGVEGSRGLEFQEIPAFPPQQPTSCLSGTPGAGMTAMAGMTAWGAGMTEGDV